VREGALQVLAVSADEPVEVDVFVVDGDLVTLAYQPLGQFQHGALA